MVQRCLYPNTFPFLGGYPSVKGGPIRSLKTSSIFSIALQVLSFIASLYRMNSPYWESIKVFFLFDLICPSHLYFQRVAVKCQWSFLPPPSILRSHSRDCYDYKGLHLLQTTYKVEEDSFFLPLQIRYLCRYIQFEILFEWLLPNCW